MKKINIKNKKSLIIVIFVIMILSLTLASYMPKIIASNVDFQILELRYELNNNKENQLVGNMFILYFIIFLCGLSVISLLGILIVNTYIKSNHKLVFLAISFILVSDIGSLFSIYYVDSRIIQTALLIMFIIGILLLLFSTRKILLDNILRSIIGFLVGFFIGIFGWMFTISLVVFFTPIAMILSNVVGCGGEDCLGVIILLYSTLLGILAMYLARFIQRAISYKK